MEKPIDIETIRNMTKEAEENGKVGEAIQGFVDEIVKKINEALTNVAREMARSYITLCIPRYSDEVFIVVPEDIILTALDVFREGRYRVYNVNFGQKDFSFTIAWTD